MAGGASEETGLATTAGKESLTLVWQWEERLAGNLLAEATALNRDEDGSCKVCSHDARKEGLRYSPLGPELSSLLSQGTVRRARPGPGCGPAASVPALT
eukprot:767530-Hanusia_phi.AAC.12